MATPFACDMTAIPASERGAHHALIRRLMSEAVEEITELRDGSPSSSLPLSPMLSRSLWARSDSAAHSLASRWS